MSVDQVAKRLSLIQSVSIRSQQANPFRRYLQEFPQSNDFADLDLREIGWIDHLRVRPLPVDKHGDDAKRRDDAKHKGRRAKDEKQLASKGSHSAISGDPHL